LRQGAGAFADRSFPFANRLRIQHPGYGPIKRSRCAIAARLTGIVGLGLLEAVPASTPRPADPDDAVGDGISGASTGPGTM
jgi:CxxC motif-containing protein (DUF1111 family)